MSLCPTATGFLMVYKYQNVSASPDDYYLYKRTCNTSFESWSSETSITLTGLISSRDKDHPELFRNQAGAIYLFFDYVDDVVDDNERRNVFYVISTDEGATWTSPVALTSYGDFSASAVAPSVSEKTNGDIVVAYNAQISVLKINGSSTGYCTSAGLGTENSITHIFYIPSSNKVYLVGSWANLGGKYLRRVLVIDVATWTIEKCYKQDGSPGWNIVWSNYGMDWTQIATAAENYIAICHDYAGIGQFNILLINTQTDEIREYHFANSSIYSYTKNVNYTLQSADSAFKLWLDISTNRLYIVMHGTYALWGAYRLGYIDITETADTITGMYTYHEVFGRQYVDSGVELLAVGSPVWTTVHFNIEEDKFVISFSGGESGDVGAIYVHVLSTGSFYKKYWINNNAGFPRSSPWHPVIINNIIYGNVWYEPNYGQEDRRGLCLIDMNTDNITFERPSYLTLDDYWLEDLQVINSGEDIIMGSIYGTIFYSVRYKTWERYANYNVPGLFTDGGDQCRRVAYDEVSKTVFTSHCYAGAYADDNFVAFIKGGSMYRGKYIQGTLSGGSYSFGSEANLHLETGGSHLTVAHDENNVLWNIWQYHAAGGEISLMWDRDSFNPDVSDYILAGSPVTVEWEIGKIARLTFTLARADLFDTSNSLSIYSPIFKKGRIAELSFGETVNGVDYWQAQGRFVVVGIQVNYRRTDHPVIEIDAEDLSSMWPQMMVTATSGYRNASLSDVFDDLLQDIAGLEAGDYSVPELANAHTLYCQWVDQDLAAIIEEICQHFNVFAHWGVDGIWTLKTIDLDADVSHDYSTAQSKLINYGPDDRYSSFINRIRVVCETNDFLEVLWDEERITQLSGVVGFWTKQETHKVYYSDDRARTVRYPRLDIIQSINDFSPLISLLGGQGDEYIQSEDPDECWCVVKIEAPNRAIYAFAFAAAIAGFGVSALYCEVRFYCGVAIMMTNLALSAFIQVVTAVANFKYDIWGQPIGHEKQTVQATADDTEFQQQMGGQIVAQQFEDPLSYSVQHCQMVADQELAIVMAQRNRIAFEKVAHMQDEIGDIIKIKHPISSHDINVFIARLKRIFTRPTSGGGMGQFIDGIEGWRI
jgi:hypothetical protein